MVKNDQRQTHSLGGFPSFKKNQKKIASKVRSREHLRGCGAIISRQLRGPLRSHQSRSKLWPWLHKLDWLNMGPEGYTMMDPRTFNFVLDSSANLQLPYYLQQQGHKTCGVPLACVLPKKKNDLITGDYRPFANVSCRLLQQPAMFHWIQMLPRFSAEPRRPIS
jgi:hypothetical protein